MPCIIHNSLKIRNSFCSMILYRTQQPAYEKENVYLSTEKRERERETKAEIEKIQNEISMNVFDSRWPSSDHCHRFVFFYFRLELLGITSINSIIFDWHNVRFVVIEFRLTFFELLSIFFFRTIKERLQPSRSG